MLLPGVRLSKHVACSQPARACGQPASSVHSRQHSSVATTSLPFVVQVGVNLSNRTPTTCIDELIAAAAAQRAAAAAAAPTPPGGGGGSGAPAARQPTSGVQPVSREALLAGILSRLEPMLEQLAAEGFEPFEAEYCRHWLHSDQQVRCAAAPVGVPGTSCSTWVPPLWREGRGRSCTPVACTRWEGRSWRRAAPCCVQKRGSSTGRAARKFGPVVGAALASANLSPHACTLRPLSFSTGPTGGGRPLGPGDCAGAQRQWIPSGARWPGGGFAAAGFLMWQVALQGRGGVGCRGGRL